MDEVCINEYARKKSSVTNVELFLCLVLTNAYYGDIIIYRYYQRIEIIFGGKDYEFEKGTKNLDGGFEQEVRFGF